MVECTPFLGQLLTKVEQLEGVGRVDLCYSLGVSEAQMAAYVDERQPLPVSVFMRLSERLQWRPEVLWRYLTVGYGPDFTEDVVPDPLYTVWACLQLVPGIEDVLVDLWQEIRADFVEQHEAIVAA